MVVDSHPQTLSKCTDVRQFREVCASLNRECAALQGTRTVCATTPRQDHTPLFRELNTVAVPEKGAFSDAGQSSRVRLSDRGVRNHLRGMVNLG